jgi:hypothetical protein
MVPFAGYAMPVQYKDMGVLQSHLWVREKAGIFDVGHMLQTRWVERSEACLLWQNLILFVFSLLLSFGSIASGLSRHTTLLRS